MPPLRVGRGLFNSVRYDALTECWDFTGTISHKKGTPNYGYGQCWYLGKKISPHRLAMVLWRGMDPNEPQDVMHTCNNKMCFNPKHLKIGTRSVNLVDAARDKLTWQSRKTHCPQGHPYSGNNLRLYTPPGEQRPRRYCKECLRERNKQ